MCFARQGSEIPARVGDFGNALENTSQSRRRIFRSHDLAGLEPCIRADPHHATCEVGGFNQLRPRSDEGGVEALFERSRRKPNLANRVDQATEQAVIKSATDFPAYGQARTSNELRKLGVFVSPSGVRSIWLRHDLANFKARLKALEAKVAEEGGILTKAQVQALEKKKLDDEACGEIETAHPGYLGSQDTFYVGTLKGVGRVYQQTYVSMSVQN